MADVQSKTPLRQVKLHLDKLPHEFAAKVALPSVGIDFGSNYVRVAIVDEVEQKVTVYLVAYKIGDVEAALHFATHNLSKLENVSVFYTGHVNTQTEALINGAFSNAKEVKRRDKLDSHNRGAHFLVSNFAEEQIFHDTSAIETKLAQPGGASAAALGAMMPPKMLGMVQQLMTEVMMAAQQKYPLLLSVVGANNIICQIEDNANYKTVESQCLGGYFLKTIWKAVGHAGHTDDFDHFIELASKGNRRKIDTLTTDILEFVGFYAVMPRDMPVFTFGKLEKLKRDDVAPEDLARATVTLTTDFLLAKASDAARLFRTYKMYFTGSLFQHEFVRDEIVEKCFGWSSMGMVRPKFFNIDATAALGACVN